MARKHVFYTRLLQGSSTGQSQLQAIAYEALKNAFQGAKFAEQSFVNDALREVRALKEAEVCIADEGLRVRVTELETLAGLMGSVLGDKSLLHIDLLTEEVRGLMAAVPGVQNALLKNDETSKVVEGILGMQTAAIKEGLFGLLGDNWLLRSQVFKNLQKRWVGAYTQLYLEVFPELKKTP